MYVCMYVYIYIYLYIMVHKFTHILKDVPKFICARQRCIMDTFILSKIVQSQYLQVFVSFV